MIVFLLLNVIFWYSLALYFNYLKNGLEEENMSLNDTIEEMKSILNKEEDFDY